MVCVFCKSPTAVINSRSQRKLHQTWRRRKCSSCGNIFTTIEVIDLSKSILVEGKNPKLEPFLREKLLFSVHASLSHSPNATIDSVALTNTIVAQLFKGLQRPIINRDQLIKVTSSVLKRFDKAAYVHYLAHHPLKTIH